MKFPQLDIEHLSPQQKLQLIEELWDSLVKAQGPPSLTPAQRTELERRNRHIDDGVVTGVPVEEAMEQIRRRTGR